MTVGVSANCKHILHTERTETERSFPGRSRSDPLQLQRQVQYNQK